MNAKKHSSWLKGNIMVCITAYGSSIWHILLPPCHLKSTQSAVQLSREFLQEIIIIIVAEVWSQNHLILMLVAHANSFLSGTAFDSHLTWKESKMTIIEISLWAGLYRQFGGKWMKNVFPTLLYYAGEFSLIIRIG